MRYCPTCQTEFDEDIIRFCTKDGTPLVDDKKPTFTENLPSETSNDDEDDFGAETIIRRKKPKPSGDTAYGMTEDTSSETRKEDSKRIVISTADKPREQSIRSKKPGSGYPPPPQKSNTALVVVMTMFGTVILLGGAFGIWWFLSNPNTNDANNNLNVNENIDVNAELNDNADNNFNLSNFNLNSNVNDNSNVNSSLNLNINTKTPTPTPTKTPTPTPTPDANTNTNANTNANITTPTPTKTPTPGNTPTPTKTPTPAKTPTPPSANSNSINVGVINGRAVRLPTPAYPSAARQARASGRVMVSVTVDETGNVISAKATSGHPLLLRPAESAALRSKFKPVSVNGDTRKAVGMIVYNFVN